MKNKKIFISGGAGVIGLELVKKLHELGAIIFVGDLKPKPGYWTEDIKYRQGDLNFLSKEDIELFQPEIFIHLAATFERSTENYDFWEKNISNNISLSSHLMSLLKDSSTLKRVIFASSYLIYDPKLYNFDIPQKKAYRLKESDPIYPRNLTGVAKLNHEIELRFLREFCNERFTSVSIRIYRGYGRGSNCVISRWIRDLLEGKSIKIYNKEGLFDYIFAEDIATGIIKLSEAPHVEGIVNLGTDNSRKVEDVINILKLHFPKMSSYEYDSKLMYEASQANMDLFKQKVSWIPNIKLEESIPKIIEFEKKVAKKRDTFRNNILITSVSKKIPLVSAVIKAAQKMNPGIEVYGGDSNLDCLGRYFVNTFWHMPSLEKLSTSEIVSYCEYNGIKIIIPTRDGELLYFAERRKELEDANITVMISDAELVKYCYDKLDFYRLSIKSGLPAIVTEISVDDIISEKYVVKERYGSGSLGVGLALSKNEAIKFAKKLIHPIYQPFKSGIEASIDIYFDSKHHVKGIIMRTRDSIVNGESQISTTFYNEKLYNLCIDFAIVNKFSGHIVLQVIINDDDDISIIECNPRYGGASNLSLAVGLESFYWFLLEANGVDLVDYPFMYNNKHKYKQIIYPSTIVQEIL
jgi:carbamoyl-phosphate synthase large subunit